jgi:nicotinate-nucleotide adenylyltransferase
MPSRTRRNLLNVRAATPMTTAGLRIGLMGGTFNPPHAGHVQVSEIARKRLGLDQVWWLVTPGNPLKANGSLPALEARMAACRALADPSHTRISGIEREIGTAFTAETLRFLKRRHPAARFVWIMGADNLAGFHRWQQWRLIARTMPMAVVNRPGWHLKALASPAARTLAQARVAERRASLLCRWDAPAWVMLHGPLSPLSSTDLRNGAGHNGTG